MKGRVNEDLTSKGKLPSLAYILFSFGFTLSSGPGAAYPETSPYRLIQDTFLYDFDQKAPGTHKNIPDRYPAGDACLCPCQS